jgi:hypothetical protein
MLSPSHGLGPYFKLDATANVGGVLQFLDPDTVAPKSAYYDQALTVLSDNPITLDSSGRLPQQVFYGVGDYLVRSYSLIDPELASPTFPTDYALITQWIDSGLEAATSTSATSLWTVDTIADLALVDPAEHVTVQVIGYFNKNDDIDNRVYKWNPLSVAGPDGGSVIVSSVLGTGRWELKFGGNTIDVRHFGAMPGSGIDCNAGFGAASAYATATLINQKEVYVPAGSYQAAAGTINFTAPLKMSRDVFFYIPSPGTLFFNITNRFDLDMDQVLINPSSLGDIILDFRTNTTAKAFGDLINPAWYVNKDKLFQYSGANFILIEEPLTLTLSVDANANLVFKKTGTITLLGTKKLKVLSVSFDSNTTGIFTHAYSGTTALEFDSTIDIYSSWFSSNETLKYASKTDCGLILNDNITLAASYTLDLTALRWIRSDGGAIILNDTSTLNAPNNLIGLIFSFIGTADTSVLTIAGPRFNSANFFLGDSFNFRQFIRLANTLKGEANFNGAAISGTLDLTGLGNVRIRDLGIGQLLNCENGPSVYQTVTLDGCRLFGTVGASYTLFNLNNCIIQTTAPIDAHEVNIENCIIKENITAGVMNINNSTIDSCTMIPDDRTGVWNFNITNNEFLGGFIIPNGSALSKRAYITGNDFQFPVGGDPATTLYLPIDDSTFTVTGETVAYYDPSSGNTAHPIAYNVLSKNNTPWRYNYPNTDLTVGTVVAQTDFEIISVYESGGSSIGAFRLGNWCLKPAMVNGQQFASIQATGLVSGNGTGGQSVSFNHLIDTTTYTLPDINIEQWSENASGNAEGFSCKFSLYPQRNI